MIKPVVLDPLSPIWIIGMILSILISTFIIQLAIRIPPDKRRILMIAMGASILIIEILQQFYYLHFDLWSIERSIPLHLCGIAIITAGFLMFKPNQIGFEFLALMGSPGALHALLTPQFNHGDLPFLVFKYYFGHAAIILVPIFLAVVEGYRIRKSSWINVFFICQGLLLFVGLSNLMLGSNYMYLVEKPLVDNPMIIGEWPWYIIGFELMGLIHIILFYAGYRKLKPLPY
tara:strand:- start:426 stop:1118 length:693 start_codon:yes stop_codon:yes gene_type:complete